MDTTMVLLVVASSLVYGYLVSRSGKPEKLPDGSIKLRIAKVILVLGFFSAVIVPIGIGWILIKWGWDSPSDLYTALGFAVIMSLVGVFLLLCYWRTSVIVSANGVETRSLRGTIICLSWNDVEQVSFSARNAAFILIGRNGEKLEVSGGMTGMRDFLKILQEKTPPSLHEEACQGYASWRKLPLL